MAREIDFMTVPATELTTADLIVDAVYQGGRKGNAGDDPLPALLRVDSQGGFRYRGSIKSALSMLVLTTSMTDPDWPDELDSETGVFTYFGDNKKPGRELHDTGRDGNLILKMIFQNHREEYSGSIIVPPVFVFSTAGYYRDVRFLGLAVPGTSGLEKSEDLVAIWRSMRGQRFQNYRARFTIIDAGTISRKWIDSIIAGAADNSLAPEAWINWLETGHRTPLVAKRNIEYRKRPEQLPQNAEDLRILKAIHRHFQGRPHDFEHCAVALAKMMIPDIVDCDVTRPSRDGGRDAVGKLRIGTGASSIVVDFALEAKCYKSPAAVGVRDMSRLISRLRHRQFGVLVTTSCVDLQAYKEIKEDQHPIIVISGIDIVGLLRKEGQGSYDRALRWLEAEFPAPSKLSGAL